MEIILIIIFIIFFFELAWKKTEYALLSIVVLLPSYLIRLKIYFIPVTFLEIMILVLFTAWFIKKLKEGQLKNIYLSSFFWSILLFLITAIISIFISPDFKAALGIFKAYFLEPILFFLVLINAIKSPQQIRLMLWATGISALYISLIALWQYIGLLPSFEPWISEVPRRVTSIFNYPNAVGLYLAPIAVLFIGLYLLSPKVKDNFNKKVADNINRFILGVIIFSLLGLFFSFTRGAFLGILAGIIFFSFFSHYKKWIWAAILLFIFLTFLFPQSRHLITSMVTLKDVSTDVRTVLWQGTWNLLKDRPWQGAGLAGFPSLYDQYRLIKHTELPLYPHNVIFNFWVELGLPGLIVFIWLAAKFFRMGIKGIKDRFNFSPLLNLNLSLVLMGTMTAVLVYGLVDVPYFKNDLSVFFWFLIGLMVVNNRLSPSSQKIHQ